MEKRIAYNLIAVLIVTAYLMLLLVLGGCTRYHVQKGVDGCAECTAVSVWSWREFEQPVIHYGRDGESVEFDFGAASATTNSPLEQIGLMAVQKMMEEQ